MAQQFGVKQLQGDWIASINALDANDVPTMLYFSDKGYKDSAGRLYLPRMRQPARINVTGNDGGLLKVMSQSSVGEIILTNIDGALNYLIDWSLDGRECTLQLVSPDGVVTTWFKGIVTRMYQSGNDLQLTLKSLSESLDLPLALGRYGGTGGVDGLTTDIKGNVIPRVYGTVINATPTLCFATSGVYQISDLTTCIVTAVYDKGVAITLGTTQTTLANLLSTSPTAGTFDRFQGYFRLGTMAVQQITCSATDAVALAGDVFKKVCDSITFSTPKRIIGQQPVITDNAAHKYNLSVSSTMSIDAVYTDGNLLGNGGVYASLTDYNNIQPAQGTFKSYQGLIRISPYLDTEYPYGEIPLGIITADATDSGVTLSSTYTVSTSSSSVTALNTVGQIGIFINSDVTVRKVLDDICKSCGAFWWFGDSLADNTTYNVSQITAALYQEPSATADLVLQDFRTLGSSSITRSANGVGENGLPIYSILTHYAKNQTIQFDVLGATPQSWKSLVSQDSLIQESADLVVKQRHPQSLRIEFDNLLIAQSDAQAVTNRLLSYFKKRCDIIDLEYMFNTLPRVTLGMTIKLYYPRLGYSNGVNFRLIGYEVDVQLKSIRMRLMGYKI